MAKRLSNNIILSLLAWFSALLVSGCSASKFVPEDDWLLDDVEIKSDDKGLDESLFMQYVRQKGNSKWFSLFKIPLGTYALSGRDTTKWINRKLQDIGESPVLFDSVQAALTCDDFAEVMRGLGYVRGKADYELEFGRKRKVKVIYNLHPGQRFHLRTIRYDIQDLGVGSLLSSVGAYGHSRLREGMPFIVNELDAERERITDLLNNNGYFYFHKDFISYSADTVRGGSGVDLTLHLHKNLVDGGGGETAHRRLR